MAPTAAHIFKSSVPTEVEAIDVDAIEDSVSVLNSVDKQTQTHPRTHLHVDWPGSGPVQVRVPWARS
jgi:hypothetical protein